MVMPAIQISEQQATELAGIIEVHEVIAFWKTHQDEYLKFLEWEASKGYKDAQLELEKLTSKLGVAV